MADGGGSTKTQNVTTTSNSAPWGPTQPGLTKAIGDLGNIYDSGGFNIPYYPGQTTAGVTPEQSQAWQMVSDLTKNPGSSSVGAATDYNNAILKGDYSALQPMFDAAKDAAGSTYEAAGRYGSGAHDNAVTKGVSSVIAQAAATAAGQAPGLQTAAYQPAQYLDSVGQERQGQAQQLINDAIAKFNYQQTAPIQAANNYAQALSGNWGGATVGTQPVQTTATNPWLQGGGLLASLLGSAAGSYFGG